MESKSGGELGGSSYNYESDGESRSVDSNPSQEAPIQGGKIEDLRKQLADLQEQLLIAQEERKLRDQIAEVQGQIEATRSKEYYKRR